MPRFLIFLALIISGCAVYDDVPVPKPIPTPKPLMPDYIWALEPYQDPELVEFYTEFADVIRRDSEIIKNMGHVREAHSKAGQLMFQNRRTKNPDLSTKVDTAFAEALGLENVALTPEKRKEVIKLLEELAWAFN